MSFRHVVGMGAAVVAAMVAVACTAADVTITDAFHQADAAPEAAVENPLGVGVAPDAGLEKLPPTESSDAGVADGSVDASVDAAPDAPGYTGACTRGPQEVAADSYQLDGLTEACGANGRTLRVSGHAWRCPYTTQGLTTVPPCLYLALVVVDDVTAVVCCP